MKKPTDITNSPCRCEECYTNFNEEIMIHPIEKTYQGSTRLSWGNTDGSGHITKVNDDFIHVWDEKEKELVKDGGTARLKLHREDKIEPPLEVTKPTSLKPREMDASDFAQPAMRAEIKVQCKFLSISYS